MTEIQRITVECFVPYACSLGIRFAKAYNLEFDDCVSQALYTLTVVGGKLDHSFNSHQHASYIAQHVIGDLRNHCRKTRNYARNLERYLTTTYYQVGMVDPFNIHFLDGVRLRDRKIIADFYLFGRSLEDIGRDLGISNRSLVWSAKRGALMRLRQAISSSAK